MGTLSSLLGLPVSGPLSGLGWIARQIAAAARQQMLDPKRIETALLLLERRLEDGLIDEATFEAEEALLLEELAEIGELRAAEANEASDEDESEPEPEPEPEPVQAAPAPEPEEWQAA
jgi:hypothetical protein